MGWLKMAGEVATLGLGFIADGQIMPGLEVESDITAICRETPELQIDPEFRDLIPSLSQDEFEALKESLSTQGCRDRLLVWKDHNILLDGHHRYQICTELRIDFDTREIELSSRSEAKIWIIKNQRGRRNLNESQRAMLAVTLEAIYCEQAKERMGTRTDLGQNLARCEAGRSAEKAAKDMGISRQTVTFAKKVATKGNPKLAKMVESGDIAVSAASKVASLPKEAQEKILKIIETQIKGGKKPKVVLAIHEIVPSDQETPKEDTDTRIEKFRKNLKANLELLQGIESIQRPENLVEMLEIAEKIIARLREIETRSLDPLTKETIAPEKEMRHFALIDEGAEKLASVQTLDYLDHELLSLLSHWQPIKYLPLLNKFKKRGWSGDEVEMKVTRLIELNLISKTKYKTKNGIVREVKVRKLTRNPFLSLTQTGRDEIKSHADTFLERFVSH